MIILSLIWMGLGIFSTFYQSYYTVFAVALDMFIISLFVLTGFLRKGLIDKEIALFDFALFLYTFSPVVRLYLLLSGTKVSEYYFSLIFFFESLVAFFLVLFKSEDKRITFKIADF